MSPEVIVLVAVAAFLILILLEVPVGISIGLAGVLGLVLLNGSSVGGRVLATTPYTASAKYALVVIPMYILLGTLIANAGIGTRIYRAVNRGVARLPGGLGAAAVIATALFSGISGSSAADVATFGRISVSEMTRHGYSKEYAAAVVAAAGTFAALIPPSVTLVIYAIIAGENVGAMIIAGVVPGALSAIILVGVVVGRAAVGPPSVGGRGSAALTASLSNSLQAAAAGTTTTGGTTTGGTTTGGTTTGGTTTGGTSTGVLSEAERRQQNRSDALAILYAIIIFGIVVGGLYGGVFTATESGAVGALAALVIAILARRSRELSVGQLLLQSLRETASVTAMIFLLLIGGAIFAILVASSRIPFELTAWAESLPVPPGVVVALFLVVLLVLGTFLDGLSTMLLTVPLMAPVVVGLGFEGVWFGVLVLKAIEIGLITPPVGINAFIISGITKVPVWDVFKRLVPFVVLDIAVTALFFVFPDIVLWMPRAAGLVQ